MSSLRQKVRKSLDICLYSYEDPDAPLKEMTDQGEGLSNSRFCSLLCNFNVSPVYCFLTDMICDSRISFPATIRQSFSLVLEIPS